MQNNVSEEENGKIISNELKKTSDLFSVPINQLEKTIKRFIKEAKPTVRLIASELKELAD